MSKFKGFSEKMFFFFAIGMLIIIITLASIVNGKLAPGIIQSDIEESSHKLTGVIVLTGILIAVMAFYLLIKEGWLRADGKILQF